MKILMELRGDKTKYLRGIFQKREAGFFLSLFFYTPSVLHLPGPGGVDDIFGDQANTVVCDK
jgi:hypothetical protein